MFEDERRKIMSAAEEANREVVEAALNKGRTAGAKAAQRTAARVVAKVKEQARLGPEKQKEKISKLQDQLGTAQKDLVDQAKAQAQLATKEKEAAKKIEDHLKTISDLEHQLDKASNARCTSSQSDNVAQQTTTEAQHTPEALRRAIIVLFAKYRAQRQELGKSHAFVEHNLRRVAVLEAEARRNSQEVINLRRNLENARRDLAHERQALAATNEARAQEVRELRGRIQDLQRELELARQGLGQSAASLGTANEAATRTEAELEDLRGRIGVLETQVVDTTRAAQSEIGRLHRAQQAETLRLREQMDEQVQQAETRRENDVQQLTAQMQNETRAHAQRLEQTQQTAINVERQLATANARIKSGIAEVAALDAIHEEEILRLQQQAGINRADEVQQLQQLRAQMQNETNAHAQQLEQNRQVATELGHRLANANARMNGEIAAAIATLRGTHKVRVEELELQVTTATTTVRERDRAAGALQHVIDGLEARLGAQEALARQNVALQNQLNEERLHCAKETQRLSLEIKRLQPQLPATNGAAVVAGESPLVEMAESSTGPKHVGLANTFDPVQSPESPSMQEPSPAGLMESEEEDPREGSSDKVQERVPEAESRDEGSDMETGDGGSDKKAEDEGSDTETGDESSDTETEGPESGDDSRDHGTNNSWYFDSKRPDRITVLMDCGGDLTRKEIKRLFKKDGSLAHHIKIFIRRLGITAVDALKKIRTKLQSDDLHALASAFSNRADIKKGLPVSSDNIRILLDAIGLERVQDVLNDAQQLGGLTAILESTEVRDDEDYRLHHESRITPSVNPTPQVPSKASTSSWRDSSVSKAGASLKRKNVGAYGQSRKRSKQTGASSGESSSEDVSPLDTNDTEYPYEEQNRYDDGSDDDSSSNRRNKGKACAFI